MLLIHITNNNPFHKKKKKNSLHIMHITNDNTFHKKTHYTLQKQPITKNKQQPITNT